MNPNSHMIIVTPSGKDCGAEYHANNSEQANEKLRELRAAGVPRKRIACYQLVEVITENTRRS